jgi:hypothetical protein
MVWAHRSNARPSSRGTVVILVATAPSHATVPSRSWVAVSSQTPRGGRSGCSYVPRGNRTASGMPRFPRLAITLPLASNGITVGHCLKKTGLGSYSDACNETARRPSGSVELVVVRMRLPPAIETDATSFCVSTKNDRPFPAAAFAGLRKDRAGRGRQCRTRPTAPGDVPDHVPSDHLHAPAGLSSVKRWHQRDSSSGSSTPVVRTSRFEAGRGVEALGAPGRYDSTHDYQRNSGATHGRIT